MDYKKINERSKCTSIGFKNGTSEFFAVIESDLSKSFPDALTEMLRDFTQILKVYELSENNIVFSRFYLSDIANQQIQLTPSALFTLLAQAPYSIIQQAPLGAGKISLLIYFVKSETMTMSTLSPNNWHTNGQLMGINYRQYWSGNYTDSERFDAHTQTSNIFSSYDKYLASKEINLYDNVIRTWIYVRDIDNHYSGMVEARKELFIKHGLTADTHYIASTGIEARLKDPQNIVSMDALAVDGIVPEQIVQMEALENLNPTHEYGVTFERGTKVIYGDREHYYISGTASIDKNGEVVHLGDVVKQTKRTLDNIEALLRPHSASLDDMAYLIVYLRNITQVAEVESILRERIGHDIPLVVVQGSVCRPTWLIEIEGVGIRSAQSNFPDFA